MTPESTAVRNGFMLSDMFDDDTMIKQWELLESGEVAASSWDDDYDYPHEQEDFILSYGTHDA